MTVPSLFQVALALLKLSERHLEDLIVEGLINCLSRTSAIIYSRVLESYQVTFSYYCIRKPGLEIHKL